MAKRTKAQREKISQAVKESWKRRKAAVMISLGNGRVRKIRPGTKSRVSGEDFEVSSGSVFKDIGSRRAKNGSGPADVVIRLEGVRKRYLQDVDELLGELRSSLTRE